LEEGGGDWLEKQQKRALETMKAKADKKKKAEEAPTKEVASWSQ
jgi:hypothetical protein